MINGVAPVIVFTFTNIGIRFDSLGLPAIVPIYLDENLTGVASDGTNDRITIETQTFKDSTYQRKAAQTLTLNMRISKNNVVGSTILALMSKIYDLVGADENGGQDYFVTVYYDSSFMLRGYLSGFEKNTLGDTNQYEMRATFTTKSTSDKVLDILSKKDNYFNINPRG